MKKTVIERHKVMASVLTLVTLIEFASVLGHSVDSYKEVDENRYSAIPIGQSETHTNELDPVTPPYQVSA